MLRQTRSIFLTLLTHSSLILTTKNHATDSEMGLPILPPSTSLAVADEPEHVRAAFLTKLYTHLFLANSASVLALLGLTHPVPRKTLAENPLLLVPAALFWVASLAGWARTRRRATTCSISALSGALNVAAHAGEAVYFGAVLAIAINVFETFIPQLNLYPIVRPKLR